MSDYYATEIFSKLTDAVGDNEFFLHFDGLKNDESLVNRMYHIIQQPIYWTAYHVGLPLLLGYDKPFTDVFAKQLCPSTVMETRFCVNETLANARNMMDVAFKYIPFPNYPDWGDITTSGPMAISKSMMGDMSMAHMSVSGISSAHSIAKAVSYMLFSGEVIDKDTLKQMIAESIRKLDLALGEQSRFSIGGFNHVKYHGVNWYGWGGWGGSVMMFSVEHECVVAFTVTAFNSPHYKALGEPRINTIMNMVSLQLVNDKKQ